MRSYSFRQASHDDIPQLVAMTRDTPLHLHILSFRYPSLEHFFGEAAAGAHAARVCCDERGAVLGWACCSSFNARSGYARTVQLSAQVHEELATGDLQLGLLANCELGCAERGVRTMVAFTHETMVATFELYQKFGFGLCGHLELSNGDRLRVHCKRLART